MAYRDKETAAKKKREYYLKNKDKFWTYEKRKFSSDKWRKANKEKIKLYMKEKYYDKKEKLLAKTKEWRELNVGYVKAKENKKTKLLTDAYMRKHLIKLGYTRTQIRLNPKLIESHRLIIKIKRLCKTSKN